MSVRARTALTLALFALPIACSTSTEQADVSVDAGDRADTSSPPADDTGAARDVAATDAARDSATTADARVGDATPDSAPVDSAPADTAGLPAPEKALVEMPADSWLEAPSSSFLGSAVCTSVGGVEGCSSIIDDWCGGAFDPVHDRMLLWGGGHDGYWGNEVYSFDPKTFGWTRATDPSAVTADNQSKDPLDDGRPVSRHTYDHVAYLTHVDRLWSRGGAQARNGGSTGLTWTLDVDARTWTNMAPATSPYPSSFGTYAGASAYDPKSKLVFLETVEGFQTYDYDSNTWTRLADFGYAPLWPRYAVYGPKRGAIDGKRRTFWGMGSGGYFVWDLDAAKAVTDAWITTGGGDFDNTTAVDGRADQVIKTGGGDVITATAPGVDYEPHADALVAWIGGGPRVLDLASKTWTTKSSTGAPPTPVGNGTYGRWRYIAKYNVFVLVNHADQNVFFYKLTAGLGS
ncbi:MAG: hypothetical protein NVSMB47_04740 [Polyangiales bacterium]